MSNAQRRFETLVHAYAQDLYRFAYWLCRNRAQAEDLVQETYLRAWRALGSLRDEAAAKSWLLTILRREFLRRPAATTPIEAAGLHPLPAAFDGLDALAVRRAVLALPTEYREPLLLQVLGGYRCEEIAAALDLPVGTVMTRVFRARRKLRDVLAPGTPANADAQVCHELP